MSLTLLGHIYGLVVVVLTFLTNVLLLFLILRQKWGRRGQEMLLILTICIMDMMFAAVYLVRYSHAFLTKTSVAEHEGMCTWSGTFLSLAMNLSICWIALLSYVRYAAIVGGKEHRRLVWILVGVGISFPIILFSLLGGYFRLYVVTPGGLSCQIWSPTRDDPMRTPIQAYFAFNLAFSLVVMVICYACIALHHHRALERHSSPSLDSNLIQPTGEKSRLPRMRSFISPNPTQDLDAHQQQSMVRRRIMCILLAYLFCHLPKCGIGLGEIISGFTRTETLNAIAFLPRFLFALVNPTVVLAMHSHTRQALRSLVTDISSKIFD